MHINDKINELATELGDNNRGLLLLLSISDYVEHLERDFTNLKNEKEHTAVLSIIRGRME